MPGGCLAPNGLQRLVVVVGNTLTILTRAAEITLGWELKKKIPVSNYKPPVWKEHFVTNLVPSKWLLSLQGGGVGVGIRLFNHFSDPNNFPASQTAMARFHL